MGFPCFEYLFSVLCFAFTRASGFILSIKRGTPNWTAERIFLNKFTCSLLCFSSEHPLVSSQFAMLFYDRELLPKLKSQGALNSKADLWNQIIYIFNSSSKNRAKSSVIYFVVKTMFFSTQATTGFWLISCLYHVLQDLSMGNLSCYSLAR